MIATRGFSLVELLITLAILSVLAVMTVPVAQFAVQRAKEEELKSSLREIRNAIDEYKRASDEGRIRREAGQSGYPRSLRELVEGVEDQKDPNRSVIYFLRRIPRDPMSDDFSVEADKTWRVRSYTSAAEEPKEGNDVFDVLSKSDKIGLNGVYYKEW